MTAIRPLAELHDAGIRFALNVDRIRLEPTRGTIPPPMMQRITDHTPGAGEMHSSPGGDNLGVPLHLAIDEGLPGVALVALSANDLRACADLPSDTLRAFQRAFQRALARSQHMTVGDVPEGWTLAADCAGCRPVLLWPDAPASVIACHWCWIRRARRTIPRPRAG